MALEFLIILTNHRKLGDLLVPYIIDRKPNQSFFNLIEILTTENYDTYPYPFTEVQMQLIKITSEYTEKQIHKLFCKGKNLKDFFDSIDDSIIETLIRPYCEKRIIKCLHILQNEKIKIYKKEKKYQVVHTEEEIFIANETLQPVFNFYHSENELKYSLTFNFQNKPIKLINQPYSILSNMPLAVLINRNIFLIDAIDSKKIIPFFSKNYILVSEKNKLNYLKTFVRSTIEKFPVKVYGFQVITIEPKPKSILLFDSNLLGEPVFRLFFKYDIKTFEYNVSPENNYVCFEGNEQEFYFKKIIRNEEYERNMINYLKQFDFCNDQGSIFKHKFLEGDIVVQLYEMINWINHNISRLKDLGFEVIVSDHYKKYYTQNIELTTKIEEGIDWFDIKTRIVFDGFEFPFIRFKKHILNNIREFVLPNNQIVILPSTWFTRYRDLFLFSQVEKEGIRVKKYYFELLNDKFEQQTNFKNAISQLRNSLKPENISENILPKNLNARLREYQKKGFYWMYQLYNNRLGGCLADDMGLGKTLQTIALLLKVKEENKNFHLPRNQGKTIKQLKLFENPIPQNEYVNCTSLIVMPVSLIHNWENEIRKFAPTLKIIKYTGIQRTKNIHDLYDADVILSSYGIIRNEIERLKNLTFKYLILDESQIIKNPDSKIYKAVLELNAEHRLVLTGTPIENSLIDLWAQMNFLNRQMLLNISTFREEFATPIEKNNDSEKQQLLKKIIAPFILRRKKEDVLHDLPSLTEQILYCDMTDDQKEYYDNELSAARNEIIYYLDQQGFEKSSIIILRALNRLRLISNHPILVNHEYRGESGKYEEIIRSIENIVSEKHKVLIFSSYVKHIQLIEKYLQENLFSYTILTGATQNREEAVKKFQNDENTRIFLISLKAGGTGLNLTAADYVFLIDPWWNPAAENQAISRAHRIGQDKKVFVYRFITTQSIEEKIITLQLKKQHLADTFVNSNNPFKIFDQNDIIELFN